MRARNPSAIKVPGFFVEGDAKARRVGGTGFGGNGQVVTAATAKARRSRRDDTREPFALKQPPPDSSRLVS